MGHSDVDVRRLSLIDFSFEDDRLIDTSPARLSGRHFSGQADDRSSELWPGMDLEKADEEGNAISSRPLELVEEQASNTPENYNLRKSLAWDSAFFTSDGVLEPEELTSMIENAGKKEKHTLPMILEETQRSTESISTLASDTLTLASLEDELFEDIRASIQKSRKTSKVQTFSSEAGQSFFEAYAHPSLTKTDVVSHGKLKAKPAPKKSSLIMIGPAKTTNQVPIHRRVSQVQFDAVGGDSNSSSLLNRPSKPGMVSPVPSSTKRDPMGADRMKPEKTNKEGAIGRVASASKVPVSSGARSIVPRPLSSRSSSARSASDKTKKMTTPPDSSASGSSDKTGKSPVNLRNKDVDPRPRKLSSAGFSALKTPPRGTISHLSGHFVSATNFSSNISPSSSISEWSSDSSSSTSSLQQRSNGTRASLNPDSSEKTCYDGYNGQQLDGPKTHRSARSALHLNSASTGEMLLPSNSMRPSGLRVPSPKIGFFDGMKSGPTPNADQQSSLVAPSGLRKARVKISKPDGSINKANVVQFRSARTATAIGSMKGVST